MLTTSDIVAARKITAAALERLSEDFAPAKEYTKPKIEPLLLLTPLAHACAATKLWRHVDVAPEALTHRVLAVPQPSPRNPKTSLSFEAQKAIFEAAEDKRLRKQHARSGLSREEEF